VHAVTRAFALPARSGRTGRRVPRKPEPSFRGNARPPIPAFSFNHFAQRGSAFPQILVDCGFPPKIRARRRVGGLAVWRRKCFFPNLAANMLPRVVDPFLRTQVFLKENFRDWTRHMRASVLRRSAPLTHNKIKPWARSALRRRLTKVMSARIPRLVRFPRDSGHRDFFEKFSQYSASRRVENI